MIGITADVAADASNLKVTYQQSDTKSFQIFSHFIKSGLKSPERNKTAIPENVA